MREDEQVADAMGISTTRYKLLAFRDGRGDRLDGRRDLRRQHRLAHDRELPDHRVDHGARVIILGGMGASRASSSARSS